MKKQYTTDVSMDGRVCIITGANSGVGFETAVQLAKHSAHLVMVCRSKERGEAAKAKIEAVAKGPVDLVLADLSLLAEVRTFPDFSDDLESEFGGFHIGGLPEFHRCGFRGRFDTMEWSFLTTQEYFGRSSPAKMDLKKDSKLWGASEPPRPRRPEHWRPEPR